MGNGKMIGLVFKKRFFGIGNFDKLKRKTGKQQFQQKPAGKMLKALMRMGNFFLKRNSVQKEIFILFYFPNAQPCGFVNILLKKNRHGRKILNYFATGKLTIKNQKIKIIHDPF